MSRWKPNAVNANVLQILCRPDVLVSLCADISLIGDRSSPPIIISSVEHRGNDIASFFISIEVPISFRNDFLVLIDSYTRKT